MSARAISYLSPTTPSFWAWEGESIVFLSGLTLTFRDELTQLIRHLQPFGLPPMPSLLLFMAATRTQWPLPAGLREAWQRSQQAYDVDLLRQHLPQEWETSVETFLTAIHLVPGKWRSSLEGKCLLAEICFEDCQNRLSPDESHAVLKLLDYGFIPPDTPAAEDPSAAATQLAQGLHPLLWNPTDLSTNRLEVRMRTGLDALIGAGHQERPLSLQVHSLLTTLQGDPEWQGFVQLTRNLMGTAYIPRALADPGDLPLDEFCDLSNRGSLDRLLISELAQDDLVLSVRLALNEALFLRRESQPKSPQNARLLLVDNGIRLWGIPRLFAVAVGLAIESATAEDTRLEAFVPTRNQQLREVRLHTQSGLIEALSHLHSHAHPGNALLELIHRLNQQGHDGDVILVTQADVIDDPAFQSITALVPRSLYVATVNRSGQFTLYHCRQEHRKLLREAKLDLKVLTDSQHQTTNLHNTRMPSGLPSIFHQHPFPIRLPHAFIPKRTLKTANDEALCVVGDGRLLYFPNLGKGGIQLCDQLPRGTAVPVYHRKALDEAQHFAAVFHKPLGLTISVVHQVSGKCDQIRIRCKRKPTHVLILHQMALVVHPSQITLHHLNSGGEQIGEHVPDHPIKECRGDLALLDNRWYRIAIDGLKPRLELTNDEPHRPPITHEPLAVTLRKQFRGIIIMEATNLVLFPRCKGQPVTITHREDSQELRFHPWSLPCKQPALFRDIAGPKGARYRLHEATFDNGSRAILDDRGLLHLIGTGGSPELTFTLTHDGPISGWSSAGEQMGNPYHFDAAPSTPAAVFADHLANFCAATTNIVLPTSLT